MTSTDSAASVLGFAGGLTAAVVGVAIVAFGGDGFVYPLVLALVAGISGASGFAIGLHAFRRRMTPRSAMLFGALLGMVLYGVGAAVLATIYGDFMRVRIGNWMVPGLSATASFIVGALSTLLVLGRRTAYD